MTRERAHEGDLTLLGILAEVRSHQLTTKRPKTVVSVYVTLRRVKWVDMLPTG